MGKGGGRGGLVVPRIAGLILSVAGRWAENVLIRRMIIHGGVGMLLVKKRTGCRSCDKPVLECSGMLSPGDGGTGGKRVIKTGYLYNYK